MDIKPAEPKSTSFLNKLVREISFWGWFTGMVVMGFSTVFMYMSIKGYMELRQELRAHLSDPVIPEHTHEDIYELLKRDLSKHTHPIVKHEHALPEHTHPLHEHDYAPLEHKHSIWNRR